MPELRPTLPGRRASLAFLLALGLLTATLRADPPPGYYDAAAGLSGLPLQAALHAIIDDHLRIPYTSSGTDTWDVLAIAHADPGAPGNIRTVYKNASIDAGDHTQATGWNREHVWPSSYGFTNDEPCNYPYTDLHHLMPTVWAYNSARGNRPFDDCIGSCEVWPVDNSPENNYGIGFGPDGTWEVWPGKRGDVARAILYMSIRYEGGTHGITGCAEPDLRLTDDRDQIISNTAQNYSPAYMGVRTMLLEWHLDDPVDDFERDKNDAVYAFQGNRNPFIDHPEYVCLLWVCPGADAIPPTAPVGLVAIPADCSVLLGWAANQEPDLAGYDVYRSLAGGTPLRINTALVTSPAYTDTLAQNGIAYEYEIRAIDIAANASAPSAAAAATPSGVGLCSGTLVPWINEIHYDNSGADSAEGVEIAGPAGTPLAGWLVVAYDGPTGAPYLNIALSGTIPDQEAGFGTRWFIVPGMQNGAPDGLALVDAGDDVLEFIAYEGVFAATAGPAAGLTASAIGVEESESTLAGTSLQRIGAGSAAAAFSWIGAAPASAGQPNDGQILSCPASALDCDGDGLDDACEIATGAEPDIDQDGVPDPCQAGGFRRGDSNGDGVLDIADAIFTLQVLFAGALATCDDALDENDDGAADIGDAVHALSYGFAGGSPPPPPHPGCGVDPTADPLGCGAFPSCP